MDKNHIIAFTLIALIIIFYPFLMPKQEKPVTVKETAETRILIENEDIQTDGVKTEALSSEPALTAGSDEPAKELFPAPEVKDISIETDLFKAVISTKGGIIKSWKVKNYRSRADTTKIVELIPENSNNLSTLIRLRNGSVIKDAVYEADADRIEIAGDGMSKSLTLVHKASDGSVLLTKEFIFYSGKYSFDLRIDTAQLYPDLNDERSVVINWTDGLMFTEVSDNGENTNREEYYRATYYKTEAGLVEFDDNDDSNEVTGNIEWAATRSKYFELFIVPGSQKISSFVNLPASKPVTEHYTSMGFSAGFDKNTNPVKEMTVYLGPMDYEVFKSYGKGFELTMNWGWDIVKPFSLGIYWTLKWLHKYIDNYGLVIIILSLLVNTLVLPFTIKSYKSQAEMKKIQPELKQIKEKYKADLQKQQQATMELYKKHNVNPFGACLPTLLPMPILYGMFIVFGATIEFRNADFIFWITDLSLPENMLTLPFRIPFYGANVGLMPIIMGLTMYIQMKDAPSLDPNQKMMMYFMPVFLTILFNTLSSGLILYYTVGNFYRIVQVKITTRQENKAKK
jgi:YidC/Oxa1 family membrane protein insertase